MVEHIALKGGGAGGGIKCLDSYFFLYPDKDMIPIEIDGVVYDIPLPVQYLIDNLALQIKEMSSYDGVVMPN